jgi:hypothetical protein
VLVADGFVGNVLLKFYESVMGFITAADDGAGGGAAAPGPPDIDLFRVFDYTEYGGAPLLGVNGVTIICHGGSPPRRSATRSRRDPGVESRHGGHIERASPGGARAAAGKRHGEGHESPRADRRDRRDGRYLPERVLTNADLERWWTRRTSGSASAPASASGASRMRTWARPTWVRRVAHRDGARGRAAGRDRRDRAVDGDAGPAAAVDRVRHAGAARRDERGGVRHLGGVLRLHLRLSVAEGHIAAGNAEIALVVSTEKMSGIVDWDDRATCVLFGDGAGAAVLRRAQNGSGRGMLSSFIRSDGTLAELLWRPAGGVKVPMDIAVLDEKTHLVKMAGREVFKARCARWRRRPTRR